LQTESASKPGHAAAAGLTTKSDEFKKAGGEIYS